MKNALLTGSRVYGAPNEKSDIDLVILVDANTFHFFEEIDGEEGGSGGPPDSLSLYFGSKDEGGALNLIVERYEENFQAWIEGTERLVKLREERGRPIDRDEAVVVFKELFAEAEKKILLKISEEEPALNSDEIPF